MAGVAWCDSSAAERPRGAQQDKNGVSGMRMALAAAVALAAVSFSSSASGVSQDAAKPVSDRQVAVMMFVDYGRSFGYQTMLATIQIDVVKAQIARDLGLLKQKEELYRKK